MQLWVAALLFFLSIAGVVLSARKLRQKRTLRVACIALCAVIAAACAVSPTSSSASEALIVSLYLPLFLHAPIMPREELTIAPEPSASNMPRTSAAVPPCAP